jgi:hypothetical protein
MALVRAQDQQGTSRGILYRLIQMKIAIVLYETDRHAKERR